MVFSQMESGSDIIGIAARNIRDADVLISIPEIDENLYGWKPSLADLVKKQYQQPTYLGLDITLVLFFYINPYDRNFQAN
jgi:hypothetical protein